MIRAASQAAAAAFTLSALAVVSFYAMFFGVHPIAALATAVILGLVAFVTVFAAVSALVRTRLTRKTPVLGAWRGAIIAVVAVAIVATAHACLTFGSGGFVYSLVGQVGYACLVGGAPAAIAGALLGRAIESRLFPASGT